MKTLCSIVAYCLVALSACDGNTSKRDSTIQIDGKETEVKPITDSVEYHQDTSYHHNKSIPREE